MATAFTQYLVACVLAGFITLCGAAPAPDTLNAVVLKPAHEARVSKGLIKSICAGLSTPCNPTSTSAFISHPVSQSKIYLIDANRPMLVIWEAPSPNNASNAHYWDFSTYRHSYPPVSDGGDPKPLEIYPALYPIGNDRFAVAIVSVSNEMYSGGGASFSVADFVALNDNKTKHDVLYPSVPFSCSKMVRACFSEREYKTSRHCHDESSGYLTIQFPRQQNKGWAFTWNEIDWPAHTSKAKEKRVRTPFSIPSNLDGNERSKVLEKVPFCGGPA